MSVQFPLCQVVAVPAGGRSAAAHFHTHFVLTATRVCRSSFSFFIFFFFFSSALGSPMMTNQSAPVRAARWYVMNRFVPGVPVRSPSPGRARAEVVVHGQGGEVEVIVRNPGIPVVAASPLVVQIAEQTPAHRPGHREPIAHVVGRSPGARSVADAPVPVQIALPPRVTASNDAIVERRGDRSSSCSG